MISAKTALSRLRYERGFAAGVEASAKVIAATEEVVYPDGSGTVALPDGCSEVIASKVRALVPAPAASDSAPSECEKTPAITSRVIELTDKERERLNAGIPCLPRTVDEAKADHQRVCTYPDHAPKGTVPAGLMWTCPACGKETRSSDLDKGRAHALDLDELESLRAKAAPGEWRQSMSGYSIKAHSGEIVAVPHGGASATPRIIERWIIDSDYLVELHNAAPELIRRARHLEEAQATLRVVACDGDEDRCEREATTGRPCDWHHNQRLHLADMQRAEKAARELSSEQAHVAGLQRKLALAERTINTLKCASCDCTPLQMERDGLREQHRVNLARIERAERERDETVKMQAGLRVQLSAVELERDKLRIVVTRCMGAFVDLDGITVPDEASQIEDAIKALGRQRDELRAALRKIDKGPLVTDEGLRCDATYFARVTLAKVGAR